MATFSAFTIAAAQPLDILNSISTATEDSDDISKSQKDDDKSDLSEQTAKPASDTSQSNSTAATDTTATRPRGKSLQEKYRPLDASGKPLHAKIANESAANPHHTHLDLHHPSPVRIPSPSRVNNNTKFTASKIGKTEKMKIDKYEDGKQHILVGATGSVASVKIPLIVKSLLAHEEVEVQVIVTKSAKHFFDVEKLKNELGVKVWEDDDDWKVKKILFFLNRNADVG